MPAAVPADQLFGAKLITVFPDNEAIGRPTHQGTIILFNWRDGRVEGILDAALITAFRTAAASAVAVDLLAPSIIERCVVLGSGVQAFHHIRMIASIRSVQRFTLWARDIGKSARLAQEVRKKLDIQCDWDDDLERSIRDADVVCATTDARQPLVRAAWLREGSVVVAVGSGQELEDDVFVNSRVFVDHHESVTRLVPEFTPGYDRLTQLGMAAPHEIGALAKSRSLDPCRSDIAVFRSAGIGLEDLLLAATVLRTWRSKGANSIQV
jgi:ornithine cyclodeaminase